MIIVSTIKERLKKSFLFLSNSIKNGKIVDEQLKDDDDPKDELLESTESPISDIDDNNSYLSSFNENISSYIISLRSYLTKVACTMLNNRMADSYTDCRESFLSARTQLSLESTDGFLKASITFTNFYLEKGRIIGNKEDVVMQIRNWMDEFFDIVFDAEQLREDIVYKYEIAMLLNTLLIVNEMGVKTCYES